MNDENNADIDLDLDVLVGGFKRVKLNGNIIRVFPPDLTQLFTLTKLSQGLKKAKSMNDQEAMEAYLELKKGIVELIPDLENQTFTMDQLFKILELVVQMAIPANLKAMEAKGIKLSTNQKKILSRSSGK